jgi:hypothetical protein
VAPGGSVTVNFTVLSAEEGDLVNVVTMGQSNADPAPGNNQSFEFIHIPL